MTTDSFVEAVYALYTCGQFDEAIDTATKWISDPLSSKVGYKEVEFIQSIQAAALFSSSKYVKSFEMYDQLSKYHVEVFLYKINAMKCLFYNGTYFSYVP
jgi:hypothetical protein